MQDRHLCFPLYFSLVPQWPPHFYHSRIATVRRHSNATSKRLTLRCSDFTLKRIGSVGVYLNTIESRNQLRVLLDSGE